MNSHAKLYSLRMRAQDQEGKHLCGAEGIFTRKSLNLQTQAYLQRALSSPRGEACKVSITVEPLVEPPVEILMIAPITTIASAGPDEAHAHAQGLLASAGVSKKAIAVGLRFIIRQGALRGAALVHYKTGKRLEPDRTRGVRASRIGISPTSEAGLKRALARKGLTSHRVLEALVLASKIASSPGVVAELCASDDPDYTTGYVSSREFGYARLLNIKPAGNPSGGRVIFVSDSSVDALIDYLQRKAVMVTGRAQLYLDV